MKNSRRIILILLFCLGLAAPVPAVGAPTGQWGALLEVSYKFSWYPRENLQALLDLKTAEYGQSLVEYRDQLLREITGGGAPARIDPGEFRPGLPWREYYRLSLAEFCLYLANDRALHLQNATAALSVLAKKTEQPEIEFWNSVFAAHHACNKKDRSALTAEIFRIWQNTLLRLELETLLFPADAAQTGFVRSLPYLYENVVHLVVRKAILEKEIAELYPLGAVILDLQPKLTLDNGYKVMTGQLAERMRGVNSDNSNLNFAVVLLEATAMRYEFEDEKDEMRLAGKYNLARKYYEMAFAWADTGKGKAAVLTQEMGLLNYLLRRYGDRPELLLKRAHFNNAPALAHNTLEKAFLFFERLADPAIRNGGFTAEGFEDRQTYLQSMHQLLDSTAKLSIVLSDFYRSTGGPASGRDIFPAARPLEQYCNLFARQARSNPDILPDNAYFLVAHAARELAALYREHTRYSTDDRASALAFAYQLQAVELFPLDLPGVLQLAYQATLDGRVRDYFQHFSVLASRLRTTASGAGGGVRPPGEFKELTSLIPTVVPAVLENALHLLQQLPAEETTEDDLFARTIALAGNLTLRSGTKQKDAGPAAGSAGAGDLKASYFELKNHLYGATESAVHSYLRALFNEIPYDRHPYVALLEGVQ